MSKQFASTTYVNDRSFTGATGAGYQNGTTFGQYSY